MKKIALIGSPGSGKSTLSRKLSKKVNIEVYHLDAIFWNPGWVGTPKEKQIEVQKQLVNKETWIIDGNYGSTLDIRLEAADTIIYFQLPRRITIYRVIKRWIQYRNKSRPDMAEGCEERLSFDFVKFVWKFPKVQAPKIEKKLAALSNEKEVYILANQRDIDAFISSL